MTATASFRLMTYNIHRAIGVDRRFRLDRIAAIATHHDPDILLLQEVDQGVPRSRRLDLARELADMLGFAHYAFGLNVTLRTGRYGNATLSRFPITNERNIDLSVGRLKRRGCQHTTIDLSALDDHETHTPGSMEIFNLHLGLSAQERSRQLGLLARSDEFARLGAPTPCIVGGDFNDWRSLLHPTLTDVLGFSSATQRHFGTGGTLLTYPSFSPSGGLDRLYYRALALSAVRTCRLRASRVASDHLPVVADFVTQPA